MAKSKKSKFQLPPKEVPPASKKAKSTNKKLQAFIGGGGKVKTEPGTSDPQTFKNFNIKLPGDMLEAINENRGTYPRPVGQKSPGISLNQWILNAIDEKLNIESNKV